MTSIVEALARTTSQPKHRYAIEAAGGQALTIHPKRLPVNLRVGETLRVRTSYIPPLNGRTLIVFAHVLTLPGYWVCYESEYLALLPDPSIVALARIVSHWGSPLVQADITELFEREAVPCQPVPAF